MESAYFLINEKIFQNSFLYCSCVVSGSGFYFSCGIETAGKDFVIMYYGAGLCFFSQCNGQKKKQ